MDWFDTGFVVVLLCFGIQIHIISTLFIKITIMKYIYI